MVDLNNTRASEIGETSPTDASKKAIDDMVDDIVGTPEAAEEKEEGLNQKPAKEEVQKEEDPEEQPETDQDESEQEKPEDEEEDLIPKSKVQERIDKLTAKVKSLEAENKSLTSKTPQTKEEKLERLSLDDLRALKRQAKIAQRKEEDDTRLEELIDLEDKVDNMIQNYPQRFAQKQVQNLSAVLPEFAKIDPNVTSMKGDLWNTAVSIYQRSSALKNSEMGQVEAMLLAAEHVQLKRSVSNGKETTSTLSRQVNNLKKATSLEGKTRVQGDKGVNLQKLREKARTGDIMDKEEYFKEALVPEDFLRI